MQKNIKNMNGVKRYKGPFFSKRASTEENKVVAIDSPAKLDLSRKGIYMIPLSGTRQFEANATLYYAMGKWILVDIGIGFQVEDAGGVSVIMPKLDFVKNIPRDDFLGIFITHGHEDHLGGVPRNIREIESAMRSQRPEDKNWQVPIYSSPFTISLLEKKLEDLGIKEEPLLYRVQPRDVVEVGPFKVKWIAVTHSIPDNSMLAIKATIDETGREAVVLHTGDWRFDDSPVIGDESDKEALKELQKEDVISVVCDSTHAMTEGSFKSENDVKESLENIIQKINKGRVVVVCFSTNLSRIDSCARIGQRVGRKVALLGRSLNKIQEVAVAHKYLEGVEPFLTEDEAVIHNRDELLLVCVGSQGEPKSGLRRLADQTHPRITLEKGDTVIMSARMITGKEKDIDEMLNRFAERGINVITTKQDVEIHVSGHPPQEDLKELYKLVNTKTVVPVHGTSIAMLAHEKFANSQGLKSIFVKNGQVIFLGPTSDPIVSKTPPGTFVNTLHLSDVLNVVGEVKVGKVGVDGNTLIPLDGRIIRERMQLKYGYVAVSIMVKPDGSFSVETSLKGVCEGYEEYFERNLNYIVESTINKLQPDSRKNYGVLSSAVRHAVRVYFFRKRSTDPFVDVLAHMPRGIVSIKATNINSSWSLTMSDTYCEANMVKAIEKALPEISRFLSSNNRRKDNEDRIIRNQIDKCLSKFDKHLRPNIIVTLEEGNNDQNS